MVHQLEETANLIWNDVSCEKGTILVRYGKGGKFRYVPMGKTLVKLLQRYRAQIENHYGEEPLPADPVFFSRPGKKYSLRGLNSIFVRLSEKTGHHITAHMLRRGFAKCATLICGRPIEVVQTSMGHASVEQTRSYIGFLSQGDLQNARQTSPVDDALKITSNRKKIPKGK